MKVRIADGVDISLNKELMLKVSLCIVWASMASMYLRGVLNRFPAFSDYIDGIEIAYFAIPILLATPAWLNRFCLFDYLFYFLNVFYLLACYVFFPENTEYLDNNALICIFCVFSYYFVGKLVVIEKFYNVFIFLSTMCILMDLFYFLVYAPQHRLMAEVAKEDNMWSAYQLLPHVMMLLWTTLEKVRIWKILVLGAGILFLLSCGTRGPLACLGFFGVIYFFFFMNFKGAIYVKSGIVIIFILIAIYLESVIMYLARTFIGLELSTRVLEKAVAGEMGDDSYRSLLRAKLEYIMSTGNHFWGLGAFGCRNYDIIYPHFLPLDFVCTFGYVLGSILLVLLFGLIGVAFWASRGTRTQVFILFLFTLGIIKLFLSNTFLMEPYFYMLIGVCIKEVLNYRKCLLRK